MSWLRFSIFLAVAAFFYVAGVSDEIYRIASPPAIDPYTILRKLESIAGFAVVAGAMAWWLAPHGRLIARLVAGMALYSALIEIGQRLAGSQERNLESLFDIGCGAVGGLIVGLIATRISHRSKAGRTLGGMPARRGRERD